MARDNGHRTDPQAAGKVHRPAFSHTELWGVLESNSIYLFHTQRSTIHKGALGE